MSFIQLQILLFYPLSSVIRVLIYVYILESGSFKDADLSGDTVAGLMTYGLAKTYDSHTLHSVMALSCRVLA